MDSTVWILPTSIQSWYRAMPKATLITSVIFLSIRKATSGNPDMAVLLLTEHLMEKSNSLILRMARLQVSLIMKVVY